MTGLGNGPVALHPEQRNEILLATFAPSRL